MNNRAFRVDDNSINSFTPSYAGTQGAIATHSNLSATTAHSILKKIKEMLLMQPLEQCL